MKRPELLRPDKKSLTLRIPVRSRITLMKNIVATQLAASVKRSTKTARTATTVTQPFQVISADFFEVRVELVVLLLLAERAKEISSLFSKTND